MRDLHAVTKKMPVVAPQVATDDTPLVGDIIDRVDFDGLEFCIQSGTIADADATVAVLVEHGDDAALADAVEVPDVELLGTEADASLAASDDGVVKSIGYGGFKRYVRLTLTPTNNTGNLPISALAVLGYPKLAPVN